MNLSEAQADRRARAEQTLDAWADARLDAVGLSEDALKLGTADVSPSARTKLKGIIKRLATKKHKFTTCMNDLRKNHPEWSDERRKKTCNVLKELAGGKNGGSSKGMKASEAGACVLVDAQVMTLLDRADLSGLKEDE